MIKLIDEFTSFFVEAFAHIFSANKDAYPNVGVQPYSGDPFSGDVELKW
jgi:hypothetical protein